MIQKPMARSVIAAVVVVGMLTLCLVATKPLTNTALGQAKTSCKLGLVWIQPKEPVIIHANLKCNGEPVNGATVNINAGGESKSVTTDSSGTGSATFNLAHSSSPYTVKGEFAGDSEHEPATAETGFSIDKNGVACSGALKSEGGLC